MAAKLDLEARRATQSVVENLACPDCDGTMKLDAL
jgi:hypothetical protein